MMNEMNERIFFPDTNLVLLSCRNYEVASSWNFSTTNRNRPLLVLLIELGTHPHFIPDFPPPFLQKMFHATPDSVPDPFVSFALERFGQLQQLFLCTFAEGRIRHHLNGGPLVENVLHERYEKIIQNKSQGGAKPTEKCRNK